MIQNGPIVKSMSKVLLGKLRGGVANRKCSQHPLTPTPPTPQTPTVTTTSITTRRWHFLCMCTLQTGMIKPRTRTERLIWF